jgi:ferredoxin
VDTSRDPYLEELLQKYDRWLERGKISYPSRVIPVRESLPADQWVLPEEKVMEILGNSETIAVQDCECRTIYERCDHPLRVCLLLNEFARKNIKNGKAEAIDLSEASQILKEANRSGLVHLSLFMPDHAIFALCSCCSCCCHDFQIIQRYRRKGIMVHSEYFAITDLSLCNHCGICVERCSFSARLIDEQQLIFSKESCMGCGLCVSTCPEEAINMIFRE